MRLHGTDRQLSSIWESFCSGWEHLHGTLSFLEGCSLKLLQTCLYTHILEDTIERGEMVGIWRAYFSSARGHLHHTYTHIFIGRN